jgi:hypothetical protein
MALFFYCENLSRYREKRYRGHSKDSVTERKKVSSVRTLSVKYTINNCIINNFISHFYRLMNRNLREENNL